jgi:GTPase SAR1 family protein
VKLRAILPLPEGHLATEATAQDLIGQETTLRMMDMCIPGRIIEADVVDDGQSMSVLVEIESWD